ncbi:MAG: glycosyltransferase family 39 protein [bacterium]|nr:glycosyltransferase family 39 protein [bacterium]
MKQFIQTFRSNYTPLQQLLWIGFFLRLFSVFFSKGFGWHDDHFLIIEASQSWVDGYDYNDWLPSAAAPDRTPSGHSLFYTGIHYFLFKFLTSLGVVNPQTKMYVVRFLHACWSLLIIKYGYKITEQYASQKTAWYVGIFLTFFWFMPFISVRNLVEFVCVPLILMSIYELGKENLGWRHFFLGGLWLGIAFSIRFQTIFLGAGVVLALLVRRTSFKHLLLFGITYLAGIVLIQGGIDMMIWKRPFAEFQTYVQYNLDNSDQYGTDNWHMYLDLIFGLLIPPLSIVLFAGYFYSWKKTALIFWPVFFYLLFHFYFPNKQERFVMTVIPLIIISGTVGMFMLFEKYQSKINRPLLRFCKIFVIALNLILLPVLTVSYSKRHRVEAMYYLYKKHDKGSFLIEDSNHNNFMMPPLFYYGKWVGMRGVTKETPLKELVNFYKSQPAAEQPRYVIFWEAENLEARLDSVRYYFPGVRYETTIQPSFIDKTLFWLNPLNSNQTTFIYKLQQ